MSVPGRWCRTDLIDKILRWRANPFSLPNVLANPEFPSKTDIELLAQGGFAAGSLLSLAVGSR
jgi:hypothetical protein